jgi:hypothetical protein
LREQDIQFMAELVDFAPQLLSHFTDHWCNQTEMDIGPECGISRLGGKSVGR